LKAFLSGWQIFRGCSEIQAGLEVQYASIKQIPEKFGHFLDKLPLVIYQSVACR
jgi:hypothetical protein